MKTLTHKTRDHFMLNNSNIFTCKMQHKHADNKKKDLARVGSRFQQSVLFSLHPAMYQEKEKK